jgi:hypothetical protein
VLLKIYANFPPPQALLPPPHALLPAAAARPPAASSTNVSVACWVSRILATAVMTLRASSGLMSGLAETIADTAISTVVGVAGVCDVAAMGYSFYWFYTETDLAIGHDPVLKARP